MTRRDLLATAVYRTAEYSHLAVMVAAALLSVHLLQGHGLTGWPLLAAAVLIGAGAAHLYDAPLPFTDWSLADLVALPVGPVTRWAGWTPIDDDEPVAS
ncbi:hypothetical protein [Streptomyces sp. NPDC001380]|uniref:hypothetical protein n=1 Tax=Streptomyces sp. NPDC001380 TaxID=3364566 RepID=UPI003696B669